MNLEFFLNKLLLPIKKEKKEKKKKMYQNGSGDTLSSVGPVGIIII